ncbi:hypothetical protein E5Q_05692 [Mixia osmundae IAM 14324]|uniref:Uncharacterized protein n=2 Tax=Mixia osmundae (strain CBS 9802 / IAM 14324 / JCM 22182 / KY 12970) TaxID=764103 RepID=G7E843_MIXOS|nr:hypothetical protein E5Q_05692 [Mixia osmundae IAM 14324]
MKFTAALSSALLAFTTIATVQSAATPVDSHALDTRADTVALFPFQEAYVQVSLDGKILFEMWFGLAFAKFENRLEFQEYGKDKIQQSSASWVPNNTDQRCEVWDLELDDTVELFLCYRRDQKVFDTFSMNVPSKAEENPALDVRLGACQ